MRTIRILFSFLFIFCVFSGKARANEAILDAMRSEMASMKQMIELLQATVKTQNELLMRQDVRIAGLEKSGPLPAPNVSPPAGVPVIQGLSQGFNPDIGVVSTIQAILTENKSDTEGNNTIALKEVELNLAQYVDPYSRMDAVISFNDALEAQNVELEEGYYTHWGLPFGFVGQIGKSRSKIGKQNLLHADQLDTVDYPLVIRDFFGEEGLASSGARLQNMVPNLWDVPVEITGEVLRGNNGASFSGISRRPIFNAHVKTFFDVTDDSNLELGWTTLFGDENPTGDRYGVKVFGGDVTFNWVLPEGRKLEFQNELYFQNRTGRVHANDDPWGFYSLLDFRISQQLSTGIRFDYLEPLDVTGDHHQTTEISPYLTFWQSEFANFRLQYSHTEPAGSAEKTNDALYLQAHILIGSHQHPVQ